MYEINLYIGLLGMATILVAFIMNQLNKWSNNSFAYDSANFFGSTLMVYYAFTLNSWPFLILNLVWALVSLKDLSARLK